MVPRNNMCFYRYRCTRLRSRETAGIPSVFQATRLGRRRLYVGPLFVRYTCLCNGWSMFVKTKPNNACTPKAKYCHMYPIKKNNLSLLSTHAGSVGFSVWRGQKSLWYLSRVSRLSGTSMSSHDSRQNRHPSVLWALHRGAALIATCPGPKLHLTGSQITDISARISLTFSSQGHNTR